MSESKNVRFGIFPKMLIAMVFIALLPLGVIWYINFKSTTDRIYEHVNLQLNRMTEGLVSYVDTWVEMNMRMLRHNAVLPQIQSMDPDQQNPFLEKITREYAWNYLAFTVDGFGQNIGRSDGKSTKYYGDRVYVKQVLKGAAHGQQVLLGKTSGKPAFVLSVPIRDKYQSMKGVLAIAMTVSDLSKKITQSQGSKTGTAFLVDENGKVIAHQSEEYTKTRRDLSEHPAVLAAQMGKTNLVYTNERGQKIVAATKSTEFGWFLVAEQTYDEAFAEIESFNRKALLLLLGTLIIVFLVSLMLSRKLSIPIQRLTTASEEVSRGELDYKIMYTNRGDEIGALARAIDRLSTSTRLAMERLSGRQKLSKIKG